MKRVILTFIIIIVGFLYFSFFINNEKPERKNYTNLYVDRDLENLNALKLYLITRSINTGIKIRMMEFDEENIDSILLVDKNGVFISDKKLKSHLYGMEYTNLSFVCVVTVSPYSSKIELSSGELNRYIVDTLASVNTELVEEKKKSKEKKSEARELSNQKFSAHRSSFFIEKSEANIQGVDVGFIESLSLDRRFLMLEGNYPTIRNILDGKYRGVFKGYVAFTGTNRRILNDLITDELEMIEESGITIIAGGDVMLSRGVERSIKKYGRDYPFRGIKNYLKKGDISFANLESPLTYSNNRFLPFKGIYFKAAPENVYHLADAGFDVLSLANNHIFDWGIEGTVDSIRYLNKVGIKWTGVGRNLKEALKPADFYIKGNRVGFIACNNIYPTWINEAGKRMIMPTLDDVIELNVSGKLDRKYNILVLSVHGGVEYAKEPDAMLINKFHKLVDGGVDIIFGSHPHVIQGIEIYKRRIIAYSLGNLIFDQDWSEETSTGLLLEVGIVKGEPIYFFPSIIRIDKARPEIVRTGAYNSLVPQKSRGGIFYAKK